MSSGLSAVIITRNEEADIRRCLESLHGVADEVIVVDSGSSDRTEEYCLAHGTRFVPHEWAGYAAQKNFANSLAAHRFILSIDADEALSAELRASILRQKERGFGGLYSMNRRTSYCGRWIYHCGWYPDVKVRLFEADRAHWTGDFVHETLDYDAGAVVTHLDGDLLHYSYSSVYEHRQRTEHYAELGARALAARGETGSWIKGILSGAAKFVRMYFLKRGILDGRIGLTICSISAYGAYLKYRKLASQSRH